jgi:hypothetical protein
LREEEPAVADADARSRAERLDDDPLRGWPNPMPTPLLPPAPEGRSL